jgi:hypothetical protein
MDESKRRVMRFLEKEIKTYTALASFLSNEGIKECLRLGDTGIVVRPSVLQGENERGEETCT